jgi:hypothetical protein
VSGGGYAGACLSAALSKTGGASYPFGEDVSDSDAVKHIRNYSNYLLPRGRSAFRNWAEVAVLLMRGLLANAVSVLAFMLIAVLVTLVAFPAADQLGQTNFLPRLAIGLVAVAESTVGVGSELIHHGPAAAIAFLETTLAAHHTIAGLSLRFAVPLVLAGLLALVLLVWAISRSVPLFDKLTSDTASTFLSLASVLLLMIIVAGFLDLQPLVVEWLGNRSPVRLYLPEVSTGFLAVAGAISGFASTFGKYLESSKRSAGVVTMLLRFATRVAILVGALVLPLFLWGAYLALCAWAMPPAAADAGGFLAAAHRIERLLALCLASLLTMCCLRANGYSLHRLYRDRLSKAFLVGAGSQVDVSSNSTKATRKAAERLGDLPPLDRLKLSELQSSSGPYPLINTALNVQGSLEANKRGRNADFFTFTPDFVGSDLTGYATTETMEKRDGRLDLGSAMAISGAAASANMGGNTVRLLSPTLSLLNVRLGYYLKNPAFIAPARNVRERLAAWRGELADRFFLLIEMFNGLTERRRNVYLTDGGHIENLGVYELLRRRCSLIVAIDAEADPELGCGSLLKLERFARIDLGIRIVLPWEGIARKSREIAAGLPDRSYPCDKGPHCALGRILYPDGPEGLLLYVKSSLSGDEKDYILDYATRHPTFPHESTGDQFFSEEQFEMYRALGFHMVDGAFKSDALSFLDKVDGGFPDQEAARRAFKAALLGAAAESCT